MRFWRWFVKSVCRDRRWKTPNILSAYFMVKPKPLSGTKNTGLPSVVA